MLRVTEERRTHKLEILHFYNKNTTISFLLPIGWEEYSDFKNTVVYMDEIDEDNENKTLDPKIAISLFPIKDKNENLLHESMESLKNEYKIIENLNSSYDKIDGQKSLIDDFIFHDNIEFYQKQVFLIIDDVLFSISMISPAQEKEDYKLIFQNAVDSIRFILEKSYDK